VSLLITLPMQSKHGHYHNSVKWNGARYKSLRDWRGFICKFSETPRRNFRISGKIVNTLRRRDAIIGESSVPWRKNFETLVNSGISDTDLSELVCRTFGQIYSSITKEVITAMNAVMWCCKEIWKMKATNILSL